MKNLFMGGFALLLSITYYNTAFSHCEVPCGIYHDKNRIEMMQEDIDTMEKAIVKIKELSTKNDPQSKNQLVRWIITKEDHAKKFQYTVWQYFLTQRVKPVSPENHDEYHRYLKKIELLHKLSFYAMKVKQNTDTKYTAKLRKLLEEFERLYFGKEHNHKHDHSH